MKFEIKKRTIIIISFIGFAIFIFILFSFVTTIENIETKTDIVRANLLVNRYMGSQSGKWEPIHANFMLEAGYKKDKFGNLTNVYVQFDLSNYPNDRDLLKEVNLDSVELKMFAISSFGNIKNLDINKYLTTVYTCIEKDSLNLTIIT